LASFRLSRTVSLIALCASLVVLWVLDMPFAPR
jgi:hypothetical protein